MKMTHIDIAQPCHTAAVSLAATVFLQLQQESLANAR